MTVNPPDPLRPYDHYEVDPYQHQQHQYGQQGPLPPVQLPYGQSVSGTPYSPDQPPMPQVFVVPASELPKSNLAVVALTFSIIGLVGLCCTFGVPSLFAIIFGHAARADTKRGVKGGHSTATAGLVLGYIGIV